MRIVRIIFATLMFLTWVILFLDFSGVLSSYLAWVAQIQLIPALIMVNVGVFLTIFILTLIFGRIYCSFVCPLGIMQDLFSALRGKTKSHRYWEKTRLLSGVRYGLLAIFLISLVAGVMCVVSILDPYTAFGRIATTLTAPFRSGVENSALQLYSVEAGIKGAFEIVLAILTLIGVGVAAFFTGRGYCLAVCPVGTLLGLIGKWAPYRIRIDESKCKNCSSCSNKCKAHCIDLQNHKIDTERCVVCMNCLNVCKSGAISYNGSLVEFVKSAKHFGMRRNEQANANDDSKNNEAYNDFMVRFRDCDFDISNAKTLNFNLPYRPNIQESNLNSENCENTVAKQVSSPRTTKNSSVPRMVQNVAPQKAEFVQNDTEPVVISKEKDVLPMLRTGEYEAPFVCKDEKRVIKMGAPEIIGNESDVLPMLRTGEYEAPLVIKGEKRVIKMDAPEVIENIVEVEQLSDMESYEELGASGLDQDSDGVLKDEFTSYTNMPKASRSRLIVENAINNLEMPEDAPVCLDEIKL